MLEIYGDAWDLRKQGYSLCITTNGDLTKTGECVMGRGIALQMKQKCPQFPKILGDVLRIHGNIVHRFIFNNGIIYSFPVKQRWNKDADIELIKTSCLVLQGKLQPSERVLLPRPGCGNGKLKWSEVKTVIEPLLDDRISIIHWKKEDNNHET